MCSVEAFEKCNVRKYLGKVVEECGCIPFNITMTSMTKYPTMVNYRNTLLLIIILSKSICSPIGNECVENMTSVEECFVTCSGLHADDVQSNVSKTYVKLFKYMKSKYVEYKRSISDNMLFNPSDRLIGKLTF